MNVPEQPTRRSASADSPCVQVCALHADGSYCVGCLRTSTEIGAWSTYSANERDAVLRELKVRRRQRREVRRMNLGARRNSST